MTDGVIETFLDEVREAGKVRGLITEEHVEIIRSALVNGYNAAGDDPRLMDLWDGVRDVITDRRMSVKARLAEMGRVAERWDEQQRGRSH
jgi:hypothetical protein